MTFSSLPDNYAPVGKPLVCTLSGVTDARVDVRIVLSPNILLGTKRFVGQSAPTFDLAPYLRRAAAFSSLVTNTTGITAAADRQLMVHLEAESDSENCSSPSMIFRPAQFDEQPTALLTTLPSERLLAPDETDELTFLAAQAQPLQLVVSYRDGSQEVQTHVVPSHTLALFRIAAADFPEANRLVVDAGGCGTISYTLLPAAEGACRLAWMSSRGSLEHYTFPVVQRIEYAVEKERGYGEQGYCVGQLEREERWVLQSAFECDELLDGLKEILSSDQVWLVRPTGYERVDVVTDRVETHRHGVLSSLTIAIRSILKNTKL